LLEEDEVLRSSDSTREITQPSKVEIARSVPLETQTIEPEALSEDLIESYQPESPILHGMNDSNQLLNNASDIPKMLAMIVSSIIQARAMREMVMNQVTNYPIPRESSKESLALSCLGPTMEILEYSRSRCVIC
jgi:hypothetical protein